MLNIIFPINGTGERFKKENYVFPKSLIKINGEPQIIHVINSLNLDFEKFNIIFVISKKLDEFRFQDIIRQKFKTNNFQTLVLNEITHGASETVYKSLLQCKILEKYPLLILDADNIYNNKLINKCLNNENKIFYFNSLDQNPIYSYIQHKENIVYNIEEKIKISDNACCGAYLFENKNTFCSLFDSLDFNIKEELYISHLYKKLIKINKVSCEEIENFYCIGTPFQTKIFSIISNDNNKTICFDLDNTLITFPQTYGDYNSCLPIKKMIEFVRNLKNKKCKIIIYSSRGMLSCNGNIGMINLKTNIILETLQKFNIPCDELYLGKPVADLYIDDLAINSFNDIEKETGFYFEKIHSRDFNLLYKNKKTIIKKGNIHGELFFYQNCPKFIKSYLPELISFSDSFIEIEFINSPLLSTYNIDGKLTKSILLDLLNVTKKIHQYSVEIDNIDIYKNYFEKLNSRKELIFSYINKENFYLLEDSLKFCQEYEKNKNGKCTIIHGDLNFSNIFYNKDFKFIDMRGKIGNIYSIYGDMFYDYAKIYQSLYGYDFIINDLAGYTINNELLTTFNEFISYNFGEKYINIIKNLTKSLIISLIPFHCQTKSNNFINLYKSIV